MLGRSAEFALVGAVVPIVVAFSAPFRDWARLALRRLRRDDVPGFLDDATLFGQDGAAMAWDGERAFAFVELYAPALETCSLSPSGRSDAQTVPWSPLVAALRQFDVRLASVTVVSVSRKPDGEDGFSRAYRAALGPQAAGSWARTVVAVAVDLLGSMDSVAARSSRGGAPVGLGKVALVSARRLVERLRAHGQECDVMDPSAVRSFASEQKLVKCVGTERFTRIGNGSQSGAGCVWHRGGFSPIAGAARDLAADGWYTSAVRILGAGDPRRPVIPLLQGSTVFSPGFAGSGSGTRPAFARQRECIQRTGVLSLARDARAPKVKPPASGVLLYPQGSGVLVGHNSERRPVTMSFQRSEGSVFWFSGPERDGAVLLARLAATGHAALAQGVSQSFTDAVARMPRGVFGDVIFTRDEIFARERAAQDQAIVCHVGKLPADACNGLVVSGSVATLFRGGEGQELLWEPSASEFAALGL